ncbi:MAG: hypothetical protein BRD45_01485 [Bacteroidetes bacterium QS_8_64_10]|nr:MAG: hypothetical protein BRD45_01485 [Bacteroidetes bacterium QS_8_64_10]
MRTFPQRLAFTLAPALALLLAACGDQQQTGGDVDPAQMDTDTVETTRGMGTSGDTVQVTLSDFEIEVPDTVSAGRTVFRVENTASQTEHNFEIENGQMEKVFDQTLAPGASDTMSVDLSPGSYEVYCPVADHELRGMQTNLTVRPATGGQGMSSSDTTSSM